MSNTAPNANARCSPRFPAEGVLLDNCALVRLWKCDALDVLAGTVRLCVASHVAKEFQRQGPTERAALERLRIEKYSVRPGSREWEFFSQIRGAMLSTRDLGEDESLAVALAQAEQGVWLPFVTYDRAAAEQASSRGVATLDFLDMLSWLVGCGAITSERADAIEELAQGVDGWKRPTGYNGSIESVRGARQESVISRVAQWRGVR